MEQKMREQLTQSLNDRLKQQMEWPKEITPLEAKDICRGVPMRNDKGQACLTAWATDTFMHGAASHDVFDTFRVAFQIAAIDKTGKHYVHMGPCNDDGDQTTVDIAGIFNAATKLVGYTDDGKRTQTG